MIFHMSDFPKRRNLFIYTNSNTQKNNKNNDTKMELFVFLLLLYAREMQVTVAIQ
jgi:hypothetical protein